MTLHHALTLARVSNVPTVWSNILMAWVLAGGSLSSGLLLVLTGGTLLYIGGCTLNDAFDARWDRAHKPDRLIPSLAVTERQVWLLGGTEMLLGLLILILARPSATLLPLALTACILTYDFRHKENPCSVVIMGACRALLILSAAAATGPSLNLPILIAALTVWLYIITLSLLARRESRPGGSLLRTLRPNWSIGRWVAEMLAAIPLLDALILLTFALSQATAPAWPALTLCLLFWPLCRLLQRKYAAT